MNLVNNSNLYNIDKISILPDEIIWMINRLLDVNSSHNFIKINKLVYQISINDLYTEKMRYLELKYYFKRFKEKLMIQQILNYIQESVIMRLNNYEL